jgi:16S rRNA (adenine1518-N6/adenine1519-N6)-dimethyltransferase
MVLTFEPKKKFIKLKNPKNLEKITEIMFSSRRKIIKNSILKLFKKNNFIEKELGINLQLRPENLDREIFYKLASKYESLLR